MGITALVAILLFGLTESALTQSSQSAPPRLYSPSSFWNTPIPPGARSDPNSAAMVQKALVRHGASSVFANGDKWGVPVAIASEAAKSYDVACTRYCTAPSIRFRIPAGARPATGSDHHLAVLDGTRELDLWQAKHDTIRDTWSASTVLINDASGPGASCPEGKHCNGAVAAGVALLGGLVWPHELRAGRIDHALAITTPFTRAGAIACPATHTDGRQADPDAIPEGARIQLDPAFDVASQPWPAWKKALALALQRYGAYVVDTGGALAVRGVSDANLRYNSWAAAGIPTQVGLSDLPWDRMRVLQLRWCN
jgi:hypothetical protein